MPLTRFEIDGLFGDRSVALDLDSNVGILIDENGTGKTTILAALFYILTKNITRLGRIPFERVTLTFSDGKSVAFDGAEVRTRRPHALVDEVAHLIRLWSREQAPLIYREASRSDFLFESIVELQHLARRRGSVNGHPIGRYLEQSGLIPSDILIEILAHADTAYLASRMRAPSKSRRDPDDPIHDKFREIRERLSGDVLYWPTYRRIEEDLQNLGYDPSASSTARGSERLIRFGMQDVSQRLGAIVTEIRGSSVQWYSIVLGKMVSQLTDGITVTPEQRESLKDPAALGIVLGRIGDTIEVDRREHILDLVRTDAIREAKFDPLVYFLSNLLAIYEKQRETDNAIKAFAQACNDFLRDKSVKYDESRLEINVVDNDSGAALELAGLSSGEKQIVSIFSSLIFSRTTKNIVLFDEPELSLSLEWQRLLLPKIMSTGRVELLLAASHSPFIYENEFDPSARALRVRRTPSLRVSTEPVLDDAE